MGTIPQELLTFKTNVESNLDGMNTACTKLIEKVKELMEANKTAKTGVDSYYNSSNKDTIVSKFSKLNTISGKISTSLTSDLQKMLTDSKTLLDKIKELEDINKIIEEQQTIINNEKGEDDASLERKRNATLEISNKESEFSSKKMEAETLYNNLKSMDESLSFVEEFTITDYEKLLSQLQGGTFEKKSYKASNGVTINYYVYIPDYGQDVEGLPIHIYMHGSGETGNGVLDCALPKMLKEKTITPTGIVICPQASTTHDFYDADYQNAIVELTKKVAEEQNADLDRVSLSGHSMGAIAEYSMIARHPNFFSAFVPISGRGSISEGLKNVKIWAFHGDQDSNVSYSETKNIISQLKKAGKNANLHTFVGKGHGNVQNYTFEQEYEDSDGEMINPLEWAFKQTKEA